MKPSVWISSGIAVLAGLGYLGATSFDSGLGKRGDDGQASAGIAFVPPPPTSRIGVTYRRDGDDSFADVTVATVEPFDADGDGMSDNGAAMLQFAEDARPAMAASGHALAGRDMLLKVASKSVDIAQGANEGNDAEPADDGKQLRRVIPSTWQSQYFVDNPLVGAVFDAEGTPSNETALIGAAKGARYLLLGEIHDNPDHHRIQADILDGVADPAERSPSVVFEMIPQSFADTLDAFNASSAKDISALSRDLEWNERGWPDFSTYRPIFEAAVRNDLPLKAGDLDRKTIGAIGKDGLSALTEGEIDRLSLDRLPGADEAEELAAEVRSAHCGLMPDSAIEPMALVQRARDGALAAAMNEAAEDAGRSVLITGAGHARRDRGVPAILSRTDPEGRSVAVRMVEVEGEEDDIAEYGLIGSAVAPYDFTIFTPKSDVSDHCAELKAQMAKGAK